MSRSRVKGSLKRAVFEFPAEIFTSTSDLHKWRGRWNEYFGNDYPLRFELGMGRGRFMADLCARGERANYIGMELKPDRCVIARKKILHKAKSKFVLICGWGELLPQVFAPGELDRVYLNFPDPWPTVQYAKRRMFGAHFLNLYKSVLAPGGEVWFKSDHEICYKELLSSIPGQMEILDHGIDMHAAEWSSEGIVTEYERRYIEQGKNIFYARLVKQKPGVEILRVEAAGDLFGV
jgi:tRNA (guanine-N7-)-methyltransferase